MDKKDQSNLSILPLSNVLKCLFMYSSVAHLERILALEETTPRGIKPVLVHRHCCLLGLLVGLLADLVVLVHHCLGLLLGHHTVTDELLAVQVQDVLVLLDDGVHDWLCEHRLVNFIVAKLPVPDQINDNIPGGKNVFKASKQSSSTSAKLNATQQRGWQP